MDTKTLTDIVDLAWADIHGADPGALGMVTIVTARNPNGDVDMNIVATIPPEFVVSLLLEAAQRWLEQGAVRTRKITRKTP